jgi:hypothetical protein
MEDIEGYKEDNTDIDLSENWREDESWTELGQDRVYWRVIAVLNHSLVSIGPFYKSFSYYTWW